MCSRIELKMTETETKQLHQYVCTFCYAVGFAAVFLSDANCIYHKMVSQKLWNAVVVSHVKKPPNPPERSARAIMKEKQGCRWENTTVHQKVSRNHLAPKDLRWHNGRSYDVSNFLKR